MSTPGRLPAQLPAGLVSRSPSTPMAGVPPAAELATDGRGSALALQRSGRLNVLGPCRLAADVVESSPSGQDSWSQRAWPSEIQPTFHYQTGALSALVAEASAPNSSAPRLLFLLTAPGQAQTASSLQLLMALPAQTPQSAGGRAWPPICPGPARPHPASRTGAQHGH